MPTSSPSHPGDLGPDQEPRSNDLPPDVNAARSRFLPARICEHVRLNIPAGQPFTSAVFTSIEPRRGVVATTLGELNKKGVISRVARGTYTHDGRLPVSRRSVRNPSSLDQTRSRCGMIRAFVKEHLSSGQVFRAADVPVPGAHRDVGMSLRYLRSVGFLSSAGHGQYAFGREGQTVARVVPLISGVRAEVSGFPDARTFGPEDFLHLGKRKAVLFALSSLGREGAIVRVGRGVYAKASSGLAGSYVPLTVRIMQRIRELPPGETFATRGGMFDDLGSRADIRNTLTTFLARGRIKRAAYGTYVVVDSERPQEPAVILTIRQQALLQIEARVPHGQEFTVAVLDIPKSLNTLHCALSELNKEGVITRVALGVYVRTPLRSGKEKAAIKAD